MFAVLPAVLALATAPPVIDGVFDEWEPDTLLAVDPPGDAVGPLDITALRAVTGGPTLFIQIDLANVITHKFEYDEATQIWRNVNKELPGNPKFMMNQAELELRIGELRVAEISGAVAT